MTHATTVIHSLFVLKRVKNNKEPDKNALIYWMQRDKATETMAVGIEKCFLFFPKRINITHMDRIYRSLIITFPIPPRSCQKSGNIIQIIVTAVFCLML